MISERNVISNAGCDAWLQGIAGVSMNWGAWAGSGMAAKAGVARMERLGFGAVEPGAGAVVLGALLRSLGGPKAPAQLTGSVFLWDRWEMQAARSAQSVSRRSGVCIHMGRLDIEGSDPTEATPPGIVLGAFEI